jgi:hypothetical protein
MAAILDYFKGTPDTPEVKAAKDAITAAEDAVNAAVGDVAKAEAAVKVAEAKAGLARLMESMKNGTTVDGTASQLGRGRRKRKGGKHTKRHMKGGKSRRGRTGRKSSRL